LNAQLRTVIFPSDAASPSIFRAPHIVSLPAHPQSEGVRRPEGFGFKMETEMVEK
jgi:hypothetical protein